jgi:hypothetical protein
MHPSDHDGPRRPVRRDGSKENPCGQAGGQVKVFVLQKVQFI